MQKKAIKPDPKQQKAVKEYQAPKDIGQIKSFWSFNEIYEEFCSGAQPLTVLNKKDTEWLWGKEQEEAFQLLKDCLIKPPILRYLYSVATSS